MTLRILAVSAALLCNACVTAGLDTPEAQRGADVASNRCVLTRTYSEAHKDRRKPTGVNVMGVQYSDTGWIKFDIASENIRGNIYFQPMTDEVGCGDNHWRTYRQSFRRITREEYQVKYPDHWKAFEKIQPL